MLRMKNFNVLWVHWKIQLLRGGITNNQYRGGDCLKRGTWTARQFASLRGECLARKRGWFLRGDFDTRKHTIKTSQYFYLLMEKSLPISLSVSILQPENIYSLILKIAGHAWENQKRRSISTNHCYYQSLSP